MSFFRRRSQYEPDQRRLRRLAARVRANTTRVVLQPSQPDALGPSLGQYVRLPGANFPPAGAIPVDPTGDASIAPGAAATLITIVVPDTFRFVGVGIGFHCDDDVALGYLTWAILTTPGNDAVPGYPAQLAAIGSLRQLAEIFVLLGSSQTLIVRATIAATAPITYRYAARLRGWFYTEKVS